MYSPWGLALFSASLSLCGHRCWSCSFAIAIAGAIAVVGTIISAVFVGSGIVSIIAATGVVIDRLADGQ